MKFRPCIDIHNGEVKQIVGSSLTDEKEACSENFVSGHNSRYFARMYKEDGLTGGHVILLNPAGSPQYEGTLRQALEALREYPGGLQAGGGINADNAWMFLENGASHVIVTSYVFKDGIINFENLKLISEAVGRDKLVLDLSCRKRADKYFIVTDRWTKFTEETVSEKQLDRLAGYCAEFLVHAVDVEGKMSGIEEDLIKLLRDWDGIPVTYAGGIRNFKDIDRLSLLSGGRLDYTIGSALDIFGGNLSYRQVVERNK
ncbi:phosphoribosylformimino-5-aminoimidazole carboxamide ribotide isomerase [Parasporobacterium paucivorans]|uniref:1-(5-phosphoribosyl)-5-[(5-phosphoribosylamino)methylideneamino] imidazole-4-carboxamide isomerase n=1 Tax=Parasporobacterium paucivorans DSM 15970 TaxID=1122934 RepID=A0A1M6ETG0_9FIRM|nr:phosphoribosylformimino-5-aminoimidazole carboxamide ribotide isomerase [Parasporobacterium paucivorans]SHI88666.1 1-(5-phosphoribosyl)-5-[(5-phosphoribosylamino)methylideneamino] imidazole-4-carboxamide isomerase [Parasporobacterium paucivorans DSM 15970]